MPSMEIAAAGTCQIGVRWASAGRRMGVEWVLDGRTTSVST